MVKRAEYIESRVKEMLPIETFEDDNAFHFNPEI